MQGAKSKEKLSSVILRTFPHGEGDLVVRLITAEAGKVAAIAKHARGSRNRFAGGVETFDLGVAEVQGDLSNNSDTLLTLTGFAHQHHLRTVRQDLLKIAIASVIAESCDNLCSERHTEDGELYHIVKLGLEALDDAADKMESLRACFYAIANMIRFSGYDRSGTDKSPSRNRLLELLNQVEEATQKELRSKRPLLMELRRL